MLAKQHILPEDIATSAPIKIRNCSTANSPLVFADIYEEDINMSIWQRKLEASLQKSVHEFIRSQARFQVAMTVSPENTARALMDEFATPEHADLAEDIAELVDMFCSLFDLTQTGLRLAVIDQAMCPKFHVDKVPCRLVTTYQGIATQWLPHHAVNRTRLGAGSLGLADSHSGIYQKHDDIQQLKAGDVALLKGESWHNNENAGLVHRSPAMPEGEARLLLTLDFSS